MTSTKPTHAPTTLDTTTTTTIPKILFTDLDGTIIHNPHHLPPTIRTTSHPKATTATLHYPHTTTTCNILPSSQTGTQAYISQNTITLVEKLRKSGMIVVLITGARSSTFLSRVEGLFECDWMFWENGGRMMKGGDIEGGWSGGRLKEWVGEGDVDEKGVQVDWGEEVVKLGDLEKRGGKLWEVCRLFVKQGWKVDWRDYYTSFRVDVRKSGKTVKDFESFVKEVLPEYGLVSTFNLGKADVYPKVSGKGNAARFVLETLGIDAENAVAMFDDDNDLELGALCGRAFLPGVTHPSVLKAMEKYPSWTITKEQGPLGTEEALKNILALRSEFVVNN